MALTRFCRVYRSGFGISARRLGRLRINSETGAHLWCMKTSRALTTTDAGHDDVHDDEVDNVVHGAFEASYSIKDLAAELGVPVQTLYDLRTQGRGPVGFRIGRCLRFRRSEIDAWLARLEEEDADRHGGDA
ncbi:helix-turn-helix domain-containing protein [Nocardioides sp.]|uniref:helix-turn-helix transcriptional regulator n=1 Tax=Nocardioides sp. TaxID=35761 RepID=UPI0025D808CE|nr:helix-turn-helix domain-containing protein [Nocardioides sp.]